MKYDEDRAHDPAFQAVDEAGGGEQEGFEQAEEQLRNNAEHGEHDAALAGFPEERESTPDDVAYGDADQIVKSSEVVDEEGEPGAAGTSS
jgi:hypothetical protein